MIYRYKHIDNFFNKLTSNEVLKFFSSLDNVNIYPNFNTLYFNVSLQRALEEDFILNLLKKESFIKNWSYFKDEYYKLNDIILTYSLGYRDGAHNQIYMLPHKYYKIIDKAIKLKAFE